MVSWQSVDTASALQWCVRPAPLRLLVALLLLTVWVDRMFQHCVAAVTGMAMGMGMVTGMVLRERLIQRMCTGRVLCLCQLLDRFRTPWLA